jgi:hypothetical protein
LENVIIPSTVNNILDNSFGSIKSLKTVTFKPAVNTNGIIKVPYIHSGAFAGSGSQDSPIVFNCPWSEDQHKARFEGTDSEGKQKNPTFGASYCTFNFNYKEAN